MDKPIVVNLFGGPGSGKSTMAARVFSELKDRGYNAELVTEYAKDKTWEKSYAVLSNQIYVFAKQHHRLWRCADKVDIIITDSPLQLSLVYGNMSPSFETVVKEEIEKFCNVNVFLKRVKKYNPAGRSQTEDEARDLDIRIKDKVIGLGYNFDLDVPGNKESTDEILAEIEKIIESLSH